tara:strand:- start:32270 stop:34201 length:1932 start_codon:yes stop_codon:yes gene_type:complete
MKYCKILFIVLFTFLRSELISPENNELLKTIHVWFEWKQEPDASQYNIQISRDPLFSNLIKDINITKPLYIEKNVLDWNTTYFWRVRSVYLDDSYGFWIGQSSFSTNSRQIQHFDVTFDDINSIQDGLVMFGQFSPELMVGIIDKYGNELWNSGSPEEDHQLGTLLNYVSSSGQLFGKSSTSGIQFNFNHDIIWQSPSNTPIDLHEVQKLPNGNYISFVPIFELGPIAQGNWTSSFQDLGYQADGITIEYPWLAQRIIEWDKDTGQEVWSWNAFDYIDMNQYDKQAELWWDAYVSGRFDWLHSNAFYFDEIESAIYISLRHLNQITKISYPSGEVLYSIGLSEEFETGSENNICNDLRFSWQHHVQLLEDGDLLFFDNGNLSDELLGDEYRTTRIRKIKVNDDLTCETSWQYELPENLYGHGTGSVQLLDNDNYLIYTQGGFEDCSILELNQNREILWMAEASDPTSSIYRAYKIPSMYPDAFSLTVNGLTQDITGNVVELYDSNLEFNLTNHSGYTNTYFYSFRNPENDWFDDLDGTIVLDAYESRNLSFTPNQINGETEVRIDIYPENHEYSQKQMVLNLIESTNLIGDINDDDRVNVEDLILTINMILDLISNQNEADINGDGGINILDISLILNIILDY